MDATEAARRAVGTRIGTSLARCMAGAFAWRARGSAGWAPFGTAGRLGGLLPGRGSPAAVRSGGPGGRSCATYDRGCCRVGAAADFVSPRAGAAAGSGLAADFVPPTTGAAAGSGLVASRVLGRSPNGQLHAQAPSQDCRSGRFGVSSRILAIARLVADTKWHGATRVAAPPPPGRPGVRSERPGLRGRGPSVPRSGRIGRSRRVRAGSSRVCR